VYDGHRARLNILFHSNIEPERCVAGEIFKAGVLVTSADDGSGAIRISAEVWRNLCRNLIILGRARIPVARRRHVGRGIAGDIEAGIQASLAKVATFAANGPKPRSRTSSSATVSMTSARCSGRWSRTGSSTPSVFRETTWSTG